MGEANTSGVDDPHSRDLAGLNKEQLAAYRSHVFSGFSHPIALSAAQTGTQPVRVLPDFDKPGVHQMDEGDQPKEEETDSETESEKERRKAQAHERRIHEQALRNARKNPFFYGFRGH